MNTPITIITPSVGRKVWYRPSKGDLVGPIPMAVSGSPEACNAAPLDATVIAVWGDRMVNVLVTDMVGRQFPVLSVSLLQEGDEPAKASDGSIAGRYVEWMPYQTKQAAKEATAQIKPSSIASHASDVLYPAIEAAMKELQSLHPEFNYAANRAFNHLHRAFWSECPPPSSAAPLRPEIVSTQQTLKDPA